MSFLLTSAMTLVGEDTYLLVSGNWWKPTFTELLTRIHSLSPLVPYISLIFFAMNNKGECRPKIISWNICSRVHATLCVTMSVRRSVRRSVGRSVGNHFAFLYFLMFFKLFLDHLLNFYGFFLKRFWQFLLLLLFAVVRCCFLSFFVVFNCFFDVFWE